MSAAFNRLVARIAAAELPIVILLSPVLLFPSPTRLLLVLVVPAVWLCNWHANGKLIPSTPLNVALFVLLGMVAVSLVATFDVQFSLGKVSGVGLGILLFWAMVRWVTTPARLRAAVATLVLAGAALAVLGLLGANWVPIAKFEVLNAIVQRLPRAIRGVPGAEEGFNANAVAGCLVLFVPLQVALLMGAAKPSLPAWQPSDERRKWETVVQAFLLVLTAGTLLLTQSRGAWLGLVAAAVAFFAWYSRLTRTLAAAIVVGILVLTATLGLERTTNLAVSRSGTGMANSVPTRIEIWSRAIYGIQDFPFTGMGMNTFRRVMPVLYPAFLTPPDWDVAHAHNHLLQAALDLGLPGLVAYGSIWIVVGSLLIVVYRHSRQLTYRIIAGGLGAGLIAHFAFSMTDAIPLGAKVGALFWLALALSVALHRIALPDSRVLQQLDIDPALSHSRD
ncbi:MAG: O-antigen ligase family protein [Vicinamibacterales bacterium]